MSRLVGDSEGVVGGWMGKVSKEKKKQGGGRGENKVAKKNWDQGRESANKKTQPGMVQG